MSDRILFVDDEPLLLESLKRELSFKFAIDTAQSGSEGLQKIAASGPYAVVVADYRMPRMSGIQFLAQVMTAAPDTVRIMLSGNADLQAAIDAVNEGQIFRFLTKPCDAAILTRILEAGLKQYHLVTAEKELLEKTLVESINMLTDVLGIVNPKAYGKSLRIRQLVHYICRRIKPAGAWQYEMAAALSQLGWIIDRKSVV
jgi:DNA-binding NtrC family response regulator